MDRWLVTSGKDHVDGCPLCGTGLMNRIDALMSPSDAPVTGAAVPAASSPIAVPGSPLIPGSPSPSSPTLAAAVGDLRATHIPSVAAAVADLRVSIRELHEVVVPAAVTGSPAEVTGSHSEVTGSPAAEVTGSHAEVTGSPAAEVTGSPAAEVAGSPAAEVTGSVAAAEVLTTRHGELGANLIARIESNREAAQARRRQRTLLREVSAASVEPPTVTGDGVVGDIAVAAPVDTQQSSLTTEDDASAAALAAAADAMSMS